MINFRDLIMLFLDCSHCFSFRPDASSIVFLLYPIFIVKPFYGALYAYCVLVCCRLRLSY